ncbi:hypothetical protein X777_12893 [Ooceraea biroi]|uniref:Uncharacterized protein n=1 Tax=Ooceraea biroi TaxID=2015173 RepID=A0A026VYK0_OOCBI|nr:hypothetical protein X777_12893 [Ooceraea biroi]
MLGAGDFSSPLLLRFPVVGSCAGRTEHADTREGNFDTRVKMKAQGALGEKWGAHVA